MASLTLYADEGFGDATALYSNPERTRHVMTCFRLLAEGELVEGNGGKTYSVTWGEPEKITYGRTSEVIARHYERMTKAAQALRSAA